MFDQVLVDLLNHHFKCLVSVASTVVVEVKVQKLDVLFKVTFVHLTDILFCKAHFSDSLVTQEVDNVDWTVGLNNVVDMDSEGLFCHLRVTSDHNIFHDSFLLPKNGNRSSNLDMAE